MYSDLFDHLGAGGGGRSGRDRGGGSSSASSAPEPTPLISFKAGKMEMNLQSGDDDNNNDENKAPVYSCTANTARGEVRLVWKEEGNSVGQLQWQWYNRKEKRVEDTFIITAGGDNDTNSNGTFERVVLSEKDSKTHKNDRIYVWTRANGEYSMYWMQDVADDKDDEIVVTVNQYLADPSSAAPPGSRTTTTTNTGSGTAGAASSTAPMDTTDGTTTNNNSSSAGSSQVDALSSILQNLGMPQSGSSSSSSSTTTNNNSGQSLGTGVATAPRTGTLTLADLQGAMSSIQTQQNLQQAQQPGPSLSEVVSSDAVTSLLQLEDDALKNRLMELLPEGQRTPEQLEENLRSPVVQQTLQSLTAALLPDDSGDMSGFYSVIANFALDPADGQDALVANNPIQAFLDCILKSVQRQQQTEQQDTTNNNNMNTDDDETTTNEKKDNDNKEG